MWLRESGRRTSTSTVLGAGLALAAAFAVGGCGASYVENDTASVLLVVDNINEGSPLLSDVRSSGDAIVNCQVVVTLSSRAKNPNSPVGPADDVQLTGYAVSYRRADGRAVEGLDVPYRISGNLSSLVGPGDTTDVPIDMVRHQAKIEPPLMNITGLDIVTMFADVTIYGHTVSGKAVSSSGSTQITFADFADGTSTCEE